MISSVYQISFTGEFRSNAVFVECYIAGNVEKNEAESMVKHIEDVHQDEFNLNSKLQLFRLIAKQATFYQLKTVEKLGYIITSLSQSNYSGVYGVHFIIQSSVKGPGHIDSRVESPLKDLESNIYKLSDEEFKTPQLHR
ncbi:unnamed protein product [Eruca vesicaria subsp. sativa]|uniref:Coenzyme PQQ synthesis protein F-like C-terminal lobe domain-containing protein n=1 Tax=Eruca vesicaria subsp. sativa TaxID=29727 RepID=A0ABC8IV14_ERUVS|nr:unnamed protein product [Eruca vesicaria subsp. sativa]